MGRTFHLYKGKVYDEQGLIRTIYGLDYDELKEKLGFSKIVSPWTVYGYIDRIHKIERVICINVYGQLITGGNAIEILKPFFVDGRPNKKVREIEGYQLYSKPGAPFPWALPREGSSILVESFWFYAEVLDTLDAYVGQLYKRIQLDTGSYLYIGEQGDGYIPFKQKRRARWANGKEIIEENGET
jgi:hypothetical protein